MGKTDEEKWISLIGLEGFVEISNLGRFKRLKRRGLTEMILPIKTDGIFTVTIESKRISGTVRLLVANHFIPNPNNYKYVIHKNKILADCNVDNLEWSKCKQSEVSLLNRVGEIHRTNTGYLCTITEYFNSSRCTIQFEDGTVLKDIRYRTIKSGGIKNYNFPDNHGVGFIGYGKYNSKDHRIAFTVWRSVIQRCYSEKHQKNFPSYIGCKMDNRWHNFQNFAQWYYKNYKPYMQGWHLDKDFLVKGNKVYSPETCCLLPNEINCLMLFPKNSTKLSVGVSRVKDKFVARIEKNGKKYHLGSFNTHLEAAMAFASNKENYAKSIAERWEGKIDERIYHILIDYKIEIDESKFK